MECDGSATEYQIIQRYLDNDQEALRFFENHGIIPTKRRCRRCNSELEIISEERHFRCYKLSPADCNVISTTSIGKLSYHVVTFVIFFIGDCMFIRESQMAIPLTVIISPP